MAQQRAERVEEQIVDRGRAAGDEQLRGLNERSQPTCGEDRRADPETQDAECSSEGDEQQRVARNVPEYVRRGLGRATAKVDERYELKLVLRSRFRREGDHEDGTDRARQRNHRKEPRARRITMGSSEDRDAEGSERDDPEQQPTEGVRAEEVARRAATEYDEPERAELDHIAPRASLCRAAWGSRPHPICSTRCQNGLAA